MQELEYAPTSVRELLTDMKNTSDLMVDLAFASLLFGSREIAKRVRELESRMDELMRRIYAIAIFAARSPEEANKITGILQVASAAEVISNATGDISDLVLSGAKIHPIIRGAIAAADEKLEKVKVSAGATIADRRIRELRLPSSIGVFIIAIKRGEGWITPVTKDEEVKVGDVLLTKGPQDGINELRKMVRATRATRARGKRSLGRKILSEMRDLSWMMVDLAYSSLLLGSGEVAEEVKELEEEFDALNRRLWSITLRAARRERDVERLGSILQVVKCVERISDAAGSMVDVVLRGAELHPVFARAMEESDERIAKVDVPERSKFVGRTLGELNLWATMGAYVLIIKRGKSHLFDPGRDVRVRAGDSLVVRGSQAGVERLMEEISLKA